MSEQAVFRQEAGLNQKRQFQNRTGSAIPYGAIVDLGQMAGVNLSPEVADDASGYAGFGSLIVCEKATTSSTGGDAGIRWYFDAAAGEATKTAASNQFLGFGTELVADADPTVEIQLAPYEQDIRWRAITLPVAGGTISKFALKGNNAFLEASIANTAAAAVVFPSSADVEQLARIKVIKTSAAAFAVTVTAASGDTIATTVAVNAIDAQNDTVTYELRGTVWAVITSTIG